MCHKKSMMEGAPYRSMIHPCATRKAWWKGFISIKMRVGLEASSILIYKRQGNEIYFFPQGKEEGFPLVCGSWKVGRLRKVLCSPAYACLQPKFPPSRHPLLRNHFLALNSSMGSTSPCISHDVFHGRLKPYPSISYLIRTFIELQNKHSVPLGRYTRRNILHTTIILCSCFHWQH